MAALSGGLERSSVASAFAMAASPSPWEGGNGGAGGWWYNAASSTKIGWMKMAWSAICPTDSKTAPMLQRRTDIRFQRAISGTSPTGPNRAVM